MSKIQNYAAYAVFAVALMATLGSLVMSELFDWPPCTLCWYQRIFMYPIVIVSCVGIARRSRDWTVTTLALAGIGWLLAAYHTLLQWGVISSALAPCAEGVSCADKEFAWLGFITIPFLSLMAFTSIIALTVVYEKGVKSE